jgi:dienelactone hydrolase
MRLGFFVGAFLLGLGVVLARLGAADGCRVEDMRLAHDAGETLRVRLFLPPRSEGPFPGVLLCHGIDNSKESMEPLALAFAQRGFVALTFDLGGHGESYRRSLGEARDIADTRRALAALAEHPAVDRRRLAVVGFSLGVPPVVQVGRENPGVQSVVALGRGLAEPAAPPRNLLVGAGVYDQFQAPGTLLAAQRLSTGRNDALPEIVCGSMRDGTARCLVLSPQTDHPLEPYDPQLMSHVIRWVEEALAVENPTPAAPRTFLRPAARSALFGGALFLVVGLIHWVLGWVRPEGLRQALFRRGVAAGGGLLCLLPVALAWTSLAAGLWLSDAGLFALLVLLASNWLLCRHAESDRPWREMPALVFRPVAVLAALVALAWLLGLLLDRALYLWHKPETLLGVPGLAVEMLFFYPNILLHRARLLLFSEYSARLIPSPLWFGILSVEAAIPGLCLTVAAQTVEKGWRAWQGKRTKRQPAVSPPTSRSTVLVRLGLGVALLASLAWSGLRVRPLDGPVTRALGLEFGGFMLLMLLVLAVLLRIIPIPGGENGQGRKTST